MRPGQSAPFVPNGESRKETAVLLVGTAAEYGIDQRAIRATSGGFYISDELADLLYDESAEEAVPEPEPESPIKNTSGNRAAKTSDTDKE